MKIAIEYFGPAREAAGLVREAIEVGPGTTARQLIEAVAKERGGRFASLLLGPDGAMSRSIMLAVENREVARDESAELRDGDEIVVIPPVAGG